MPTTDHYQPAITHLGEIGSQTTVWSTIALVQDALDRGITVAKGPHGKGLTLSYGDDRRIWRTMRIPSNSILARRVCGFKSAASTLLRAQGVAATQNVLFSGESAAEAWAWAKTKLPVVLKPDDGLQGRGVHVAIHSRGRFHQVFEELAKEYGNVLVERQYEGDQYRCFMVDGSLVAAALMRPASVEGDGARTVSELIAAKNEGRANHPSHQELPMLDAGSAVRAERNLALAVPAAGERVYLTQVSNLQRGGDSIDATDWISPERREFIRRVIKAIPGLNIAGVDVMFDPHGDTSRDVVLEVNTNPQLSIHQFPWEGESRDVAGAILDYLFPASARIGENSAGR